MLNRILPCLTLILLSTAAGADEVAPGRYQLKELGGGVVRLDTETGDMAFCKDKDGAPQCTGLGAGQQREGDVKALDERIRRLEKDVADLKLSGASGAKPLPSDEEVDRSLSIMQKFMRMFFGTVHEFEQQENPGNTLPQKT